MRKLLNKGYSVRTVDGLWYGKEPIADLLKNDNFELQEFYQRDLLGKGLCLNFKHSLRILQTKAANS